MVKRAGIEKANDRLRKMRNAIALLDKAQDWQSAADAWTAFLMAAGSFYSVLEQASKDGNRSREWYDHRKQVRRADPLLRYIHQARNTEEHGCQRVFNPASTQLSLCSEGASVHLRSDGRNWIAEDIRGDVRFARNTIELIRVRNERFGDEFDPPTHHLGRKLDNTSALHIAQLALVYLESMLVDAVTVPNK